MNPIQPYFVFSTSHYRKGLTMKRGISHFYNYYQDASDEKAVSAVPDACVDILIEKGADGMHGKVCGTVLQHTIIENKQDREYFGVRFMPGVVPAIVDISMEELVEQQYDLEPLITDKDMLKRMEEAESMYERVHIFLKSYDKALASKLQKEEKGNTINLVNWVKNEIIRSAGNITIQEISDKTGYTTRYINQVFDRMMGICPKMFCRIIKFQTVIQLINRDSSLNLTDLGIENGYYDQSHFIKDFKKFALITPKEYKNMIKERHYNQRLEIIPVE